MSQISMPIRIVVAVAAVFLVAWMTVLKPKSAEEVPAPTPITTGNVATGKPAVSLPGKLAEKAKATASGESSHASAAAGETTGSATQTAPATATKTTPPATPAVTHDALAGVPARVAKAIRHHKLVVIGFFGSKAAADDRDVRKALSKIDSWDGRVVVTAASIGHVAKWGRIAHGVDVEQSPTVVVVGSDLKATALVGYVDRREIEQAIVDSLRSTSGLFTNATMRGINRACATAADALYATPTPGNRAQALQTAKHVRATLAGFVGDVRSVEAPARLTAFKRATVADAVALRSAWTGYEGKLHGHPSPATAIAAFNSFLATVTPVEKRFDKRATKQHLLSCQEV